MEITGKLEKVNDIIERENFRSRKVWITTEDNPQYPQTIEVEVNQAKIDLFDGIAPGAPLKLYLNLRGRKWEKDGKTSVFNSLVCWKVESAGQEAKAAPASQQGFPMNEALPDDTERLPF